MEFLGFVRAEIGDAGAIEAPDDLEKEHRRRRIVRVGAFIEPVPRRVRRVRCPLAEGVEVDDVTRRRQEEQTNDKTDDRQDGEIAPDSH